MSAAAQTNFTVAILSGERPGPSADLSADTSGPESRKTIISQNSYLALHGPLARDLELLDQAGTYRGDLVMNTIEKFATAAVALAITLVGAVLVIAPMVISGPRPMM